jgi:DNA polymerase III gamma/tau subunit
MNFAVDERPTDFSQFVGNESVVRAVSLGLSNKNLPNTILITGNSGCGKTTLCNLIIKGLNVNKDINLHFIDCGVTKDIDSFRKIVEMIKAPVFGGVEENVAFILEECHKLSASKNAQEALLAVLENLPSNKYVIATTTDASVLLKTFVSRFVNYHLMPLSNEQMFQNLLLPVIKKHSIKIKKSTVNNIINVCGGNNRKALSILSSIAFLDPDEQDKNIMGGDEECSMEIKNVVNAILDAKGNIVTDFNTFTEGEYLPLGVTYEDDVIYVMKTNYNNGVLSACKSGISEDTIIRKYYTYEYAGSGKLGNLLKKTDVSLRDLLKSDEQLNSCPE